MKRLVRNFFKVFGYDVVRTFNPNLIGKYPLVDMKRMLHNDNPIVFDVGANIGQSVQKFRGGFPDCKIYSFEPSPKTFETLQQNTCNFENVSLWNCALGSSPGKMELLENSYSDMSSFLSLGKSGWGQIERRTLVEIKTIDQFCLDQKIEYIDILKSDTQGFDLEVFKGAEQMISSNKIGLIYFEITFSDIYKNLPSFSEIYDFLKSRDFLLVTFYKFYYRNSLAGWTDALFIHKSQVKFPSVTPEDYKLLPSQRRY